MSAVPSFDDSRPLDRAIARAAAEWLVRLHEDAAAEEFVACEQWRAQHPEHERAWQRAQRVNQMFSVVPRQMGLPALGRSTRVDRRNALKILTVMVVGGGAGYLAFREKPWQEWAVDERTAIGARRAVVLADGTQLDLNTDTAIKVEFSGSERRLILRRGEILVRTGADPHGASSVYRPFIVETPQGLIRALGTRFMVRQENGGDPATQVAVLEHAVEIVPSAAPQHKRIINAGQQVRFTATRLGEPGPASSHVADWSRGILFANQMRLDEFIAELSRYRVGVLRCDPAIAHLRITGAFQLDNVDNILAVLPETLPVQAIYRTRYWVSIVPPADPASG